MSDHAAEERPSDETDYARPEPPASPSDPSRPIYKGEPLEAERGPGLGCFWFQVVVLAVLLVATPLSVWLAFPPWFSAALLILTLGILFFVGQTTIFLLRLVAADRRAARRAPRSTTARKTVGMLEEEPAAADAPHVPSDEDDAAAR